MKQELENAISKAERVLLVKHIPFYDLSKIGQGYIIQHHAFSYSIGSYCCNVTLRALLLLTACKQGLSGKLDVVFQCSTLYL